MATLKDFAAKALGFKKTPNQQTALWNIRQAGSAHAVAIINEAIAAQHPKFELQDDGTVYASTNTLAWKGDTQAKLHSIQYIDPETRDHATNFQTPQTIAIFHMRVPTNSLYSNPVENFHPFFKKLGFETYKDRADYGNIPQDSDNWYAHIGGLCFTPGAVQQITGHFDIAVKLDTLLTNLGIQEKYKQEVRAAQQAKAEELGIVLEDTTDIHAIKALPQKRSLALSLLEGVGLRKGPEECRPSALD